MSLASKRRKRFAYIKVIYDGTMSIVFLCIGFIFLFFHIRNLQLDITFKVLFGVVCILYGFFRAYRGWLHFKKNIQYIDEV